MASVGRAGARAYRLAARLYRGTLGRSSQADRVARSFVDWVRQVGRLSDLTCPVAVDGALPVFVPKLEVETSARPDELRQMWNVVRQAWESLGKERPFHSVLTEDHYLPRQLDEAQAQFWQSGEIEAGALAGYLADLGLVKLNDASLLEYGCGVGRVTVPLAGLVKQVTAYDLSEPHLKLARKRAALSGRSNVRIVLLDNPIDTDFEPCDIFYSRIVLQHNPPPIIAHVLSRLIRSLRTGGVGVFQVPTYYIGYRFSVADYLCSRRLLDMEMHCFPQAELFALIAREGARLIQVRDDNATGRPDLFVSNTFVIVKVGRPDHHDQIQS
jgi:SAM-dependent methyltransferase